MKRLLIALMLCLVPTILQAAIVTRSVTFQFSYPEAAEADITGFEIYHITGTGPVVETVIMSNISPTARFATGPITYDNGTVQRFYMRAVNKGETLTEYSDPSNVARILIAPGQFKKN